MAPGVVRPDRGRTQGRAARGPELDRLRARERDRLPHLHGDGTRPVRRALLQFPARANAKASTRRAPYLAEGRVPGLTPPLRSATKRDNLAPVSEPSEGREPSTPLTIGHSTTSASSPHDARIPLVLWAGWYGPI